MKWQNAEICLKNPSEEPNAAQAWNLLLLLGGLDGLYRAFIEGEKKVGRKLVNNASYR